MSNSKEKKFVFKNPRNTAVTLIGAEIVLTINPKSVSHELTEDEVKALEGTLKGKGYLTKEEVGTAKKDAGKSDETATSGAKNDNGTKKETEKPTGKNGKDK